MRTTASATPTSILSFKRVTAIRLSKAFTGLGAEYKPNTGLCGSHKALFVLVAVLGSWDKTEWLEIPELREEVV